MGKIYQITEVGEVIPVSAGDDNMDIYVRVYEDEGGKDG